MLENSQNSQKSFLILRILDIYFRKFEDFVINLKHLHILLEFLQNSTVFSQKSLKFPK